jgi:hypothetical protein
MEDTSLRDLRAMSTDSKCLHLLACTAILTARCVLPPCCPVGKGRIEIARQVACQVHCIPSTRVRGRGHRSRTVWRDHRASAFGGDTQEHLWLCPSRSYQGALLVAQCMGEADDNTMAATGVRDGDLAELGHRGDRKLDRCWIQSNQATHRR